MNFPAQREKGMTVRTIASGGGNRRNPKAAMRVTCGALLGMSALALSGCMGAPTYGTGKPADEQLLQDMTGALSLAPKDKPNIDYAPRPGIVMPASTQVLPPPQTDVTASNPEWPESPEQRLARVRAEATANQDNPGYEPNIVRDVPTGKKESRGASPRWNEIDYQQQNIGKDRREELNQRLAERNQGSPTQRRYLSEPPLDYRQPAATAATGDVGEDEWRKEKAAKRAARQALPARARDNVPRP